MTKEDLAEIEKCKASPYYFYKKYLGGGELPDKKLFDEYVKAAEENRLRLIKHPRYGHQISITSTSS